MRYAEVRNALLRLGHQPHHATRRLVGLDLPAVGEREQIFAPYYRIPRDTGGAVGGTGIGLAVVRRLVEEHGGRVWVGSTNGDGASGGRFVVMLPTRMPEMNRR